MRGRLPAGILLCALLAGAGCAGLPSRRPTPTPPPPAAPTPATHLVRPGETLWRISRWYGVTVDDLARANGISDPTQIRVGDRLVIPGDGQPPAPGPGSHSGDEVPAGLFDWPLEGTIASPYGLRDGRPHTGIDVRAPAGTRIHAARAGTVVYSGNGFRGYGNLVILDHGDGTFSLYAHNRRNLVGDETRVDRGDPIGLVGMTGNATAPHLHFEIRRGERPVDPLPLLPAEGHVARSHRP